MVFIFSRTFAANSRLTARSGPLTATSIGGVEPKRITRVTMSLGSKLTLAPVNSFVKTPRSLSCNASIRTPAFGLNCTASHASSGPPFHWWMRLTG